MRYICLIAVLLALPLTASAQQRRSADRRPDQNRSEQRQSNDRRSDDRRSDERRSDAQRPQSASPLPWWERQQTPWWERQQMPAWEINRIPGYAQGNVARALLDQQRTQRQLDQQVRRGQVVGGYHRSRQYPPSVVYVLPSYGNIPFSLPMTAPSTPPLTDVEQIESLPRPRLGGLRLEVEPKESLQVFLDNVYIGTPLDLADELELVPGIHRIELRAPGYRTLAFDVEIVSARLTTYRGTLDRLEAAPAPTSPAATPKPQAPAGSTTMYVIPGCYLGNVSPKTVALPRGCDINKMSTILPQ